jgi:D-glycero-alpha-D-manno-heptose-7-phosphate kinase
VDVNSFLVNTGSLCLCFSAFMQFRSRAPLRLGFAGGGTDVSPFSDEYGGYVLNATINLYSYCFITPTNDGQVCFEATDRGEKFNAEAATFYPASGSLRIHKAIYNRVVRDFNRGEALTCRLTTYSDAPAGSGLGTSSTLVVAILGAYIAWLNLALGEYELAHLAYEIERIDLGMSGGKQDQYAAAFGGFNFMEFHAHDRVIVNPLRMRNSVLNELQASLLLYYTGVSRESANIISEQIRNVADKKSDALAAMHEVKADAIQTKEFLLKGELQSFARLLARSWQSKKRTAAVISNPQIETIFETALRTGAISGKVSGAGGGGYIMFMIDPAKREEISRALAIFSGSVQRFHFTASGVETWSIP